MRPETFDDNYVPRRECIAARPIVDVLRDIAELADVLRARYADDTPPIDATTAILEARALLWRVAGEKP